MNNRKKKTTTSDIENDEVEALLQAAQEDIFLKMNVHSHMIHASSSQIIHPDLDQRFQALKSNQSTQKPKPKNPSSNKPPENHHGDDDDLLGRFEALKKSLPFYEKNGNLESLGSGDEEEEEVDEVEKVIRWAKDAARLDPSPPSDTDEDEDEDDEEESEVDYDSEEDNVKKGKKGNTSKRK